MLALFGSTIAEGRADRIAASEHSRPQAAAVAAHGAITGTLAVVAAAAADKARAAASTRYRPTATGLIDRDTRAAVRRPWLVGPEVAAVSRVLAVLGRMW